MADIVDAQTRSRMMSGIKGKNTKPEILVRKALSSQGFRYRLHRKDLPGAPDIVMPGRKIAIFAHGCFWHMHQGCRLAKMPSTRPEFWQAKLGRNVERDSEAVAALAALGWRVLIAWECSTKSLVLLAALPEKLRAWIESDERLGEIGVSSQG